MSATSFMSEVLEPFGPRLPLDRLGEEVNKLYHAAEAPAYDSSHPEVLRQLPPIWEEMVAFISISHPEHLWDVLDYGCGTGFASQQILSLIPAHSINSLTCYDPSPEMLNRCKAKLGTHATAFLSDPHLLSQIRKPVNLLVTNSLLHHLSDPLVSVTGLSTLLTEDAIWLAGHEPSRRFYQNEECLAVYNDYVRHRKLDKFLTFRNYITFLRGTLNSPAAYAAKRAYKNGLFERKPSAFAVGRLVDFHVAHSGNEAISGRGFEIDEFVEHLKGEWELAWFKSYSFMGCFSTFDLSKYWVKRTSDLAEKYPKDGSNFCSVWFRTPAASHALLHTTHTADLNGKRLA